MEQYNYFVFKNNATGENIQAETAEEAVNAFWDKHNINVEKYRIIHPLKELEFEFYNESDFYVVKTDEFEDGKSFPNTEFDKYKSVAFKKVKDN